MTKFIEEPNILKPNRQLQSDEYFNEKERTHERQVTKCKSIICLNMFLVLGFFFGKKYLNSAIITLLGQGILIVHRDSTEKIM